MKNNKRLKGTDKTLLAYRDMFTLTRKYWQERNGTWLAIDIETWEMDHTAITEYGFCQVTWEGAAGEEKRMIMEDGHFIVQEYKTYQNGKYVVNNQQVSSFLLLSTKVFMLILIFIVLSFWKE